MKQYACPVCGSTEDPGSCHPPVNTKFYDEDPQKKGNYIYELTSGHWVRDWLLPVDGVGEYVRDGWEYLLIEALDLQQLNRLGKDGWELVAVAVVASAPFGYLKRKILEE